MPIGIPGSHDGPISRQPVASAENPIQDDWTFAVGPWSVGPDTGLPRITGRTVTWRLADVSEASFTIDATLPEAEAALGLISGLWVLRNGREMYRGIVGATSDSCDGNTHTIQFSAANWRAILERRFILDHDTLVYANTDVGQVAWNLINATQQRPGGDLGIIQGSTTTGVTISPQLTPGTAITDQINTWATSAQGSSQKGFDWAVTGVDGQAQLKFNVWFPQRGIDRQTVLDYPGRIQGFTRADDPGTYADAIRASGSDGLVPILSDSPTILTDPTPRLEALVSNTDLQNQTDLANWATGQLATLQDVVPSWTVTLAPNTWGGPQDFWLGDPVILNVDSGVRQVNESLRVQEIALTLDDNSDAATVAVTLGAPKPDRRWLLRALTKRIDQLSKR